MSSKLGVPSLDVVLESAGGDPASFSFYGLARTLEEVEHYLEAADRGSAAKAPGATEKAAAERRDELVEAQASLRRAMGQRLENPSITKRERPLAEDFLQQQLQRLKGREASDPRVAKAAERLQGILEALKAGKPAPENPAVLELQETIKRTEAEWKEISPIHAKWEAGRHSFKSNAELQSFKRQYADCQKTLDTAPEKLERLLRSARDEAAAAKAQKAAEKKAAEIRAGWMPTSRAPAVKASAKSTSSGRPAVPPVPKKPQTSSWGQATVSLAQRLRAEAAAKVKAEVDGEDASKAQAAEEDVDEDDDDDDGFYAPLPPARKQATNVPAKAQPPPRAPPVYTQESEEEIDEPQPASATVATNGAASATRAASSAKKRGKPKKGKTAGGGETQAEDQRDSSEASAPSNAPSVLSGLQRSFQGSLVQELLTPSGWTPPKDDSAAHERLSELSERLDWISPMGLALPFGWQDFFALAVDGGPKRTSKRGPSPAMVRLQRQLPALLAHYANMLFFLMLLHALANFDIFLVAVTAQAALLLTPHTLTPQISATARVLALQGAHLFMWLLFVRSLWTSHLFIKAFFLIACSCHSYVVSLPEDA
eukprot:TRINITY_DN24877_c0_g2_i1.p1 TRINITY_DN24877_c0_g2~~TRINITY_DN24877_c0_g2_i1.p1  ORF type:complete len:598 (-),score=121.31 TRINITY_DN24877_c0_g2_i1:193-1986(-)